ncbi:hypothetical protein T4A_5562 [Trichinella pseudospiralis]|uniref:Uncharacterized protein n=2 Tax=Trichinella pseudospiralis TaxID=6337 RepID=A0A0V1EAS0_TRIPS|nr:hypothetical protein T4E_1914 [Trichinella pseudospiralis]KRY70900.1 hypothetical protein T4A_5562 [Trichinella pseudospiralis]
MRQTDRCLFASKSHNLERQKASMSPIPTVLRYFTIFAFLLACSATDATVVSNAQSHQRDIKQNSRALCSTEDPKQCLFNLLQKMLKGNHSKGITLVNPNEFLQAQHKLLNNDDHESRDSFHIRFGKRSTFHDSKD